MLGRATEAYAKGGFTSLVLESKAELVEQYGPKSAYWRAHPTDLDPQVSTAVQANLLDLAHHYHALAQKSGSAADRDAAVRWYREYLDAFNSAPQAPATRLMLADVLFDGTRFSEAAAEYELAAYSYAQAPEAGRAGYAALVAYDKAEALLPEAERPALRLRAIDSSLRFASTFPNHAETPAVLARTTKALFDAGDRDRAEAVAHQVLALGPRADVGQQRVAWTVLAHTYFDSGRFAEAEKAYAEVVSRLPANDPRWPKSRSAAPRRSTGKPRPGRLPATPPVPCTSTSALHRWRPPRRLAPRRSSTRRPCCSRRGSGSRPRPCSRTSAAITRSTSCSRRLPASWPSRISRAVSNEGRRRAGTRRRA